MDHDTRLKRLKYRSWHRGCKETDIILGHFADRHLHRLDEPSLVLYEQLLDENDVDIWNWLTGANTPEPRYEALLEVLRERIGEEH